MTSAKLRSARALTSVLAAGALTVALVGCGQEDDPSPVADDPGGEETTQESSPPSPDDSAAEGGSGSGTTVPVYFVGDTPQGPALFREFRQVPDDNPLEEAAALLTAGDVADPDYSTLLPEGDLGSVEYDDDAGRFVVELADPGWTEPQGLSKAEARLAVQQLVYTLQGVQQERAPVVVQQDGRPTSILGIDSGDGIRQADQLAVLGLVNVTTPEQGAAVSGSFTAEGVASSFEGTVVWEVRRGDEVVQEGFATASGWMDKLYPWSTEVDVSGLEPGEYTFVARTDDPSDGEGPGPTEDTKDFTVR